MPSTNELISVKFYVLLMVGTILLLTLSLTVYIKYTDNYYDEQERLINKFHIRSVYAYERIDDELQNIRMHHTEEHLRELAPDEVKFFPEKHRDHIKVIQRLFDKLLNLRDKYKFEVMQHPTLLHHFENAIHIFDNIKIYWKEEQNKTSIDSFFETSINDLLALDAEIEVLRDGHGHIAYTINEQISKNRKHDELILFVIVFVLAMVGLFASRRFLGLIHSGITRRLEVERVLSQNLVISKGQQVEMETLRRSNKAMIMALADLAENRDSNTGEHVLRVARITQKMAQILRQSGMEEITDTFLEQIALCSMLHDVGKVSVPDIILLKPGPLNAEERMIMQHHTVAGSNFLEKIRNHQETGSYIEMAIRIARSHHEQYQGGGYPDGLVGTDIPLEARIVTVSDVYDALTSWRPYKEPWPEEKVFAFIKNESGKLFDPKIVEAFFSVKELRADFSILEWREEMSVGIPALDNDHKAIIRLINEIGLVQKQFDSITVDLVLDELFNYTIRHFNREEFVLQEIKFPNIQSHARQHADFGDKVSDLRRRYLQRSDINAANELMMVMSDWIEKHIMVEDRKYYDWCTEAGLIASQIHIQLHLNQTN